MKFVMSYSCGKDSSMALYQAIRAGHEPVALIVAGNKALERSFFHGVDRKMLDAYADALGLPLIIAFSNGDDYTERFVEGLKQAKAMDAEAVCYGDLYLPDSKAWNEAAAEAAGLIPMEPLWDTAPAQNVRDIIQAGFRCVIKIVNHEKLPESLLGRVLDEETVQIMANKGIDICGENGEYHTLVMDGPVFRYPLPVVLGDITSAGDYSYIDIRLADAGTD